ncbi:ketopantoate reductase family protein [Eubacterium sp. 1001713B170207_170306_E7]|uniref:ketopantoate reductase family protein n=1 Tax=Eubacterium sp. 1001713B170207_170306_E7 TaxID=2787097 RepID=UPI00189BCB3E|nr:ketopantoate reductase family protein [Eubacterium sp. 1001713B170207_170306_E7]
MKINKIALIGAGALGVLYGNRLTETFGNDRVFFIADRGRIARYRETPFTCNGKPCGFRYVEDTAEGETADLIIISVKYTGIDQAVKSIRHFVERHTIIISLLNGIASEEVIAKVYGQEHLLYCVAQGMDAVKEGPKVHYDSGGVLLLGSHDNSRTEPLEAVAKLMEEARICYETPQDIHYCLWNKLMLNTGVNQTAAVFKTNYGGLQQEGEARTLMLKAMEEARIAAAYEGVCLTEGDIAKWMQVLDTLNPEGMPSMRQDTKAHRKTEVELFSGTICKLGKMHGFGTPVNDFLYKQIRQIEASYD